MKISEEERRTRKSGTEVLRDGRPAEDRCEKKQHLAPRCKVWLTPTECREVTLAK